MRYDHLAVPVSPRCSCRRSLSDELPSRSSSFCAANESGGAHRRCDTECARILARARSEYLTRAALRRRLTRRQLSVPLAGCIRRNSLPDFGSRFHRFQFRLGCRQWKAQIHSAARLRSQCLTLVPALVQYECLRVSTRGFGRSRQRLWGRQPPAGAFGWCDQSRLATLGSVSQYPSAPSITLRDR